MTSEVRRSSETSDPKSNQNSSYVPVRVSAEPVPLSERNSVNCAERATMAATSSSVSVALSANSAGRSIGVRVA